MMSTCNPKRRSAWRRLATAPWLVLVAVVLLLGGCSGTQWLYRNADWMLERYAVKALDVNEAQLKTWRPILERVLQQHLASEVPILEGYLELMARAVDGSYGEPVNAACLVSAANLIFSRHATLAADLAAPLMAELDSRQIGHLSDFLALRRDRFNERYLQGDEADRQRERVLRLTQRIERWSGSLDSSQQARLEQFTLSLPDVAANWFSHRKRQEKRLLQLLYEGADVNTLHAHLLSWWIPWAGAATDFSVQWRMAQAAFILYLDELVVSFTDRQRKHFSIEVSSLQKELAGLGDGARRAIREPPRTLQCHQQQI